MLRITLLAYQFLYSRWRLSAPAGERGGATQILIIVLAAGFMALMIIFLDLITVFPVRQSATQGADAAAQAAAESIVEELDRSGYFHAEMKRDTACTFDPAGERDELAADYLGEVRRSTVRRQAERELARYARSNQVALLNRTVAYDYLPPGAAQRHWRQDIRGSRKRVYQYGVYVIAERIAPSLVEENVPVKARSGAVAYPVPNKIRIYEYRPPALCGEDEGARYFFKLHAEWRVTLLRLR